MWGKACLHFYTSIAKGIASETTLKPGEDVAVMKVLVIGGHGMLGGPVVRRLAGTDFGKMISPALSYNIGISERIPVQGEHGYSVLEAGRKFIDA
jgi:hypothetical protein